MPTDIDFAALLCSRLCHDLISPVGALSNGLEILAEEQDPDVRSQVVSLLEQSAQQTSSKLQFYRLAFGSGGGFGSLLDMREPHRALMALFTQGKVDVAWDVEPRQLDKEAVKLILNLAMLMGEALVRGGTLTVRLRQQTDHVQVEISAEGERFILADNILRAVAGEIADDEIDPRTAPGFLAGQLIKQQRASVAFEVINDQLRLFRGRIPVGDSA